MTATATALAVAALIAPPGRCGGATILLADLGFAFAANVYKQRL